MEKEISLVLAITRPLLQLSIPHVISILGGASTGGLLCMYVTDKLKAHNQRAADFKALYGWNTPFLKYEVVVHQLIIQLGTLAGAIIGALAV